MPIWMGPPTYLSFMQGAMIWGLGPLEKVYGILSLIAYGYGSLIQALSYYGQISRPDGYSGRPSHFKGSIKPGLSLTRW